MEESIKRVVDALNSGGLEAAQKAFDSEIKDLMYFEAAALRDKLQVALRDFDAGKVNDS